MKLIPVDQDHGGTEQERFRSILFGDSKAPSDLEERKGPIFFSDLNIDQIVEAVTAGLDEYNLKPYFYATLSCVETVEYRQKVFQDFENPILLEHVRSFAENLRGMRRQLAEAEKLYYKYQKHAWFLTAVEIYCETVRYFLEALSGIDLRSRGLLSFREYLRTYITSNAFVLLVAETDKLRRDLSEIKYSLRIEGKRITVSRYDAEPDYGADVLQTFDKFKQGAGKRYQFKSPAASQMDHVEAGILDLIARLHPAVFASLEDYSSRNRDYLDATIATFDREVQFYVSCVQHNEALRRNGLRFCYPQVSKDSKVISGFEAFDLALAARLAEKKGRVVTNDFYLRDRERIIVVSGPNQGGKTTFARTFGQLHYFASIGCLVPGTEARLFLFDKLFTHFEQEEAIQDLNGKLENDLLRIHDILESATPNSILIMNESFASTALSDAIFLSRQVMRRIVDYDMLCVTVTFLDEMASFGDSTVSMVSMVDPHDAVLRTFKVMRRPADGLAYAIAIAEKYHLTHSEVTMRISAKVNKQ